MGSDSSKEQEIQAFRAQHFYENGCLLPDVVKRSEPDGHEYEGQMANQKKEGYGILTKDQQLVYLGLFKNDRFHGPGRHHLPDGHIIQGNFVNGILNSQPVSEVGYEYRPSPSKTSRHGSQLKKSNVDSSPPEGLGWQKPEAVVVNNIGSQKLRWSLIESKPSEVLTTTSKQRLETDAQSGDVPDDQADVARRLVSQASEIVEQYKAQFLLTADNRLRPGITKGRIRDGGLYIGQIVSQSMCGSGMYCFQSGDTYVGNFVNNHFEGEGTYCFANGERYEGQFEAGRKQGQGQYFYCNGNYY